MLGGGGGGGLKSSLERGGGLSSGWSACGSGVHFTSR